jgi:hypothetical protein
MDNFDLKKYLVENKLTKNSQLNEFKIGDIVKVNFGEFATDKKLNQFENKPFKIVNITDKEVKDKGRMIEVKPAKEFEDDFNQIAYTAKLPYPVWEKYVENI